MTKLITYCVLAYLVLLGSPAQASEAGPSQPKAVQRPTTEIVITALTLSFALGVAKDLTKQ